MIKCENTSVHPFLPLFFSRPADIPQVLWLSTTFQFTLTIQHVLCENYQ